MAQQSNSFIWIYCFGFFFVFAFFLRLSICFFFLALYNWEGCCCCCCCEGGQQCSLNWEMVLFGCWVRASESERAAAALSQYHHQFPPPPPIPSRLLHCIRHVLFFFPLYFAQHLFPPGARSPISHHAFFFLCQTLTQYPNLHGWHLFVGAKKLRWGFRDGCLDPGCEIERWEPQRRHRNFRDQQGKKKKSRNEKIPSPKWARYGGGGGKLNAAGEEAEEWRNNNNRHNTQKTIK